VKKRLYLRELVKFDLAHGSSLVRWVEMTVDRLLKPGGEGYSIQFWKDAELYGLDEAVLYLRNSNLCTDIHEVESAAASVRRQVEKGVPDDSVD
jgi:hypothetical protein